MQIVIDIPEERLKSIKQFGIKQNEVYMLEKALITGIPLPKGHGDLIDREKLKAYINGWYAFMKDICKQPYVTFKQEEIMSNIDFMTPIIEADKED